MVKATRLVSKRSRQWIVWHNGKADLVRDEDDGSGEVIEMTYKLRQFTRHISFVQHEIAKPKCEAVDKNWPHRIGKFFECADDLQRFFDRMPMCTAAFAMFEDSSRHFRVRGGCSGEIRCTVPHVVHLLFDK